MNYFLKTGARNFANIGVSSQKLHPSMSMFKYCFKPYFCSWSGHLTVHCGQLCMFFEMDFIDCKNTEDLESMK